jgi:hypothetical protein
VGIYASSGDRLPSWLPSGPNGTAVTAQGHPRAIFSGVIENGNLVIAEATAREVKNLTLEEALRLLFLYAEKDPAKYERAALRWLSRYVSDGKEVTLLQLAVAALSCSAGNSILDGYPPAPLHAITNHPTLLTSER